MNNFKKYASSCAFRVELTQPQIAKMFEIGKIEETGDWKLAYEIRNPLLKVYGGVDNFLATENALIRKGLIFNNRPNGDGACVRFTEPGSAMYKLLLVSGFFEEFEKCYLDYKQVKEVAA